MANRKPIYGKGINDASYITVKTVNGKRQKCPFYVKWVSMLSRCYKQDKSRSRTYEGCTVCDEWLLFSNFKKWMSSRDWKGKELDKDIINPGNKVYNPEYCCFVSSKVNSLLCDARNNRGEHPIGVYFSQGKFQAKISTDNLIKYLGKFDTAQEAHAAWVKEKTVLFSRYIDLEKDERIKEGLRKHMLLINARLETDDNSNQTEGHNYSESPARPNRAIVGGRKQTECDK